MCARVRARTEFKGQPVGVRLSWIENEPKFNPFHLPSKIMYELCWRGKGQIWKGLKVGLSCELPLRPQNLNRSSVFHIEDQPFILFFRRNHIIIPISIEEPLSSG